jgi:hypothetical protein
MKQFAVVLAVAAFTLIAIALFNGPAPASDTKQLSQVNIQALMQNVHDLTDIRHLPCPTDFLLATTQSWPRLMAPVGVLFPLRSPVATPASARESEPRPPYRRTATARPA